MRTNKVSGVGLFLVIQSRRSWSLWSYWELLGSTAWDQYWSSAEPLPGYLAQKFDKYFSVLHILLPKTSSLKLSSRERDLYAYSSSLISCTRSCLQGQVEGRSWEKEGGSSREGHTIRFQSDSLSHRIYSQWLRWKKLTPTTQHTNLMLYV